MSRAVEFAVTLEDALARISALEHENAILTAERDLLEQERDMALLEIDRLRGKG